MATVAQTINERHLRGEYDRKHEERGTGSDVLRDIGLFLATPFVGLAFAVSYGLIGLAVVACYGLKAFGVRCGLLKG